MNIYKHILLTFIFTLFLTGCSVSTLNEEAVDYFKKESPLEVDIVVPEPILLNQPELFKVILKQNGEVVNGVNNVQFTIWKKDSSTPPKAIVAKYDEKGEYSVEKTFHEDGLYYVKVKATANGSKVMPTKQFIVGNLSKEELNQFKKDSSTPEQNHEGHH